MRQRLGELLQFIMQEIAESPDQPDQSEKIRHLLSSKGYEQSEIDTALQMIQAGTLLRTNVETGAVVPQDKFDRDGPSRQSHRVLASWERSKLTMDARELLLWLELEGFLWPEEL